MQNILNFDWSIFKWIEAHLWSHTGDSFFIFITHLGDSGIFWICLAILLLVFKKTRKVGIMMAIALLCSLLLNDLLLKKLFERPRPFDFLWPQGEFIYPDLIKKPHDFSFPSGHTASSFGAAICLFKLKSKKQKIFIAVPGLILALLIAFSRIYLHVHYPTDVIGGIVAGILYALIGIAIVTVASKKIAKKKNV